MGVGVWWGRGWLSWGGISEWRDSRWVSLMKLCGEGGGSWWAAAREVHFSPSSAISDFHSSTSRAVGRASGAQLGPILL